MLVDQIGDVTITNDGATILKQLGELNSDKLSEVQSSLSIELRAISKQLIQIEKLNQRNKNND